MSPKTSPENVEIFRTPEYVNHIGDIVLRAIDSLQGQEIGVYSQRFDKLLNNVNNDELMVPKHLVLDNHNQAALHDAYTIFCSAHLLLEGSEIDEKYWADTIKNSKQNLLSVGGLEDSQGMYVMAYIDNLNKSGEHATQFADDRTIDWTKETKDKIEEIKIRVPVDESEETGCPARKVPIIVDGNTTNLMFHFWDKFVDYIYGEPESS